MSFAKSTGIAATAVLAAVCSRRQQRRSETPSPAGATVYFIESEGQ